MVVNKKGGLIALWGFILIILSLVVAYNFEGQIGGFFTFLLQLIGLVFILASIIKKFRLKKWIKILVTVILTPIIYIIFFYLMWGITTQFKFTI